MSLVNMYAALEEFAEEVNSEIVNTVPEDGAFDEETAGVNFPEESQDIDIGTDEIINAAKGLEEIISLIDGAPGDADSPMEPFVEKAANLALESNDIVASAGNPLAKTADEGQTETKGGAIEKIKAFAAKVWEMLVNFGKRIKAWVMENYARFTDRIVKNGNTAKSIIAQVQGMAEKDGAKITDKSILAKVATFKGTEVGDVVVSVFEHAQEQGGKSSIALTKELNRCIDLVSGGASTADGMMDPFLKALEASAGTYKSDATPQQAQAVKAAAGTKTYLSDPFFAGYRAWTTVPENADALEHWNHGISKVDQVQVAESIDAPNGEMIKAIAEHIVGMGALVATYQANVKQLDELNKELDKAASKSKNAKSESPMLKKMQAVVPRMIKGPQVAAYAYASTASTAALQFCQAAIAAHTAQEPAKAE